MRRLSITAISLAAFLVAPAYAWETPPPLQTNGREPASEFLTITKDLAKNQRIFAEAMSFRYLVRCSIASLSNKYGRIPYGVSAYNEPLQGDCLNAGTNYIRYCQINTGIGMTKDGVEECYSQYLAAMLSLSKGGDLGDYSYSAPIPQKMYGQR